MDKTTFQTLRTSIGYPDVPPHFDSSWDILPNQYKPVEYVANSVKDNVPNWESPDLDEQWNRAQKFSRAGALLVRDSLTGRPLNPSGPTGISGFGRLWNYGPSLSADGIVVHQNEVLLIERSDTGQLAFPGGYRNYNTEADDHEDPITAALREVQEETHLQIEGVIRRVAESGIPKYVVRNTDNAWIEDSAVFIDVSDTPKELLNPIAGDDAKKGSARWLPFDRVDVSKMSPRHAEHVATLKSGALNNQQT